MSLFDTYDLMHEPGGFPSEMYPGYSPPGGPTSHQTLSAILSGAGAPAPGRISTALHGGNPFSNPFASAPADPSPRGADISTPMPGFSNTISTLGNIAGIKAPGAGLLAGAVENMWDASVANEVYPGLFGATKGPPGHLGVSPKHDAMGNYWGAVGRGMIDDNAILSFFSSLFGRDDQDPGDTIEDLQGVEQDVDPSLSFQPDPNVDYTADNPLGASGITPDDIAMGAMPDEGEDVLFTGGPASLDPNLPGTETINLMDDTSLIGGGLGDDIDHTVPGAAIPTIPTGLMGGGFPHFTQGALNALINQSGLQGGAFIPDTAAQLIDEGALGAIQPTAPAQDGWYNDLNPRGSYGGYGLPIDQATDADRAFGTDRMGNPIDTTWPDLDAWLDSFDSSPSSIGGGTGFDPGGGSAIFDPSFTPGADSGEW